jgi:hypothetical protein
VLLVEPAFTRTALDHNAPKPDGMLPIYDTARAAAIRLWNTSIAAGDPPEVVGTTVVTAEMPKLRYPASKTARQLHFMRRFLPAGMFDKSLRKQMGLQPWLPRNRRMA